MQCQKNRNCICFMCLNWCFYIFRKNQKVWAIKFEYKVVNHNNNPGCCDKGLNHIALFWCSVFRLYNLSIYITLLINLVFSCQTVHKVKVHLKSIIGRLILSKSRQFWYLFYALKRSHQQRKIN